MYKEEKTYKATLLTTGSCYERAGEDTAAESKEFSCFTNSLENTSVMQELALGHITAEPGTTEGHRWYPLHQP